MRVEAPTVIAPLPPIDDTQGGANIRGGSQQPLRPANQPELQPGLHPHPINYDCSSEAGC